MLGQKLYCWLSPMNAYLMADGSIKQVVQTYSLVNLPFTLPLVNAQEYRGYCNETEVVKIKS